MTHKIRSKKTIEKIVKDSLGIFQGIEDIPQLWDQSIRAYHENCRKIPEFINEGLMKIAVVGVIKSGKSTFVNSLFGKELVKRGAGVITSITTRIRKGRKNQATFYFKSWDDINLQLQNALQLFPNTGIQNKILSNFDIRRKNDRDYLEKAYEILVKDFSGVEFEIPPQILLIKNALLGFNKCKNLVQADEAIISFKSKEFDKHKHYTSDPNIAFYIKDVCLDVYGKALDPKLEIADCQGADSTDPNQLEQVLNYLESSNMIIYCVSSRIGLRRSDITFLKQIKNFGLIDNIIFINNCDLTEHENREDLIKIETNIKETLKLLEIHSPIFSFSALYNLFLNHKSKLKKKDQNRLKFWQEEKKIVQYCDLKTQEFKLYFKNILNTNRDEMLISNHLKHLDMVMAQLDQKINIYLGLLSSDKLKEKTTKNLLKDLHGNAVRLQAIVEESFKGVDTDLKEEIKLNLKNTFFYDQKAVLQKTQDYIGTFFLDVNKYKSSPKEWGFNQILYLMFQDFKRGLDLYIIEQVKPEIKRFVQSQEEKIKVYFQSLFDSYHINLFKTQEDLIFKNDLKSNFPKDDLSASVNINQIKKILGLDLPAKIFEAKYTKRIKTNVFTGFSLQTMSQILTALFNNKTGFSFSPGLNTAALKIKKENQKIVRDQFKDFHINLREQYFLPLIEAATRDFKEKIREQFTQYQVFKKEMETIIDLKHDEKKEQKKQVKAARLKIKKLSFDIASCLETPVS